MVLFWSLRVWESSCKLFDHTANLAENDTNKLIVFNLRVGNAFAFVFVFVPDSLGWRCPFLDLSANLAENDKNKMIVFNLMVGDAFAFGFVLYIEVLRFLWLFIQFHL